MRKLFSVLAVALTIAAPLAHATIIDFNNPGVVDIDNDSGRATYQEAGFSVSGEAAGFLTIDGIGTGGTGGLVLFAGNTLSIMSGNGGAFSFGSFDAGRYDATTAATLDVTGIFSDHTERSLMLPLAGLGTQSLPSAWSGLTELRFMANADVVVDNVSVSAVPEPGTTAMLLLGLGAIVGIRRGARQRARK